MTVPYGIHLRRKSYGYATVDGRYAAVRHRLEEDGKQVTRWTIHAWSPEGMQLVDGDMDDLTEVRSEIRLNISLFSPSWKQRDLTVVLYRETGDGSLVTDTGEYRIEKGEKTKDGRWHVQDLHDGKYIYRNLRTCSDAREAVRELVWCDKEAAGVVSDRLGISLDAAARVHNCLKHHSGDFADQTLAGVASCLLGTPVRTFGCELVLPGEDDRSPSIEYLNRGDSHATTVLYLGGVDCQGNPTGEGRWAIGSWGDIVEKGAYA